VEVFAVQCVSLKEETELFVIALRTKDKLISGTIFTRGLISPALRLEGGLIEEGVLILLEL